MGAGFAEIFQHMQILAAPGCANPNGLARRKRFTDRVIAQCAIVPAKKPAILHHGGAGAVAERDGTVDRTQDRQQEWERPETEDEGQIGIGPVSAKRGCGAFWSRRLEKGLDGDLRSTERLLTMWMGEELKGSLTIDCGNVEGAPIDLG